MKKINNIFRKSLLVAASLFLFSCADDDNGQLAYNGDAQLSFLKSTDQAILLLGGGDKSIEVGFGTIVPVTASHSVTLSVDTDNSTAVENVDFQIVNPTVQVAAGEVISNFDVVLLESAATTLGKTVVFKLTSPTLATASFNNSLLLNVSITCPVAPTMFVGDYLIQEITPLVDGPTLSSGEIVTLSAISGSPTGRTFQTKNFPNYCSSLMSFNFDIICQNTVSRSMQGNCSCAGNYFFGPAIVDSTIDAEDDSVFELTFTNDVESDCGNPVQTTYQFIKQ